MSTRSSLSRQACDDCKRRKVKCDSARPCSNCRASGLGCQFTTQQKRRGPAKAKKPLGLTLPPGLRLRHRSGSGIEGTTTVARDASSESRPGSATAVSPESPGLNRFGDSPAARAITSPYSGSYSPHSSTALSLSLPAPLARTGVSSTSLLGYSANDSAPLLAQAIRDELLASLVTAVPSEPPESIVTQCIDLFMRYIFPSTPIVHEGSLRSHAAAYFSAVDVNLDPAQQAHAHSHGRALFSGDEEHERVARMRHFTLVTALCSTVSAMMPPSMLACGNIVAAPFFHASSRMLKTYEEYDIEYPDSSSLCIRALFSGAAQHITGKAGFAVHVYGQAALIALSLRLYNEQALQSSNRDALEIQLLRRNFWHIYMSDKSATGLGTRPALLHDVMFVGGLTLEPHGQPFTPLLDVDNPMYSNSFEERLLLSSDLLFQLWSKGCDLILRIKAAASSSTPQDKDALTSTLTTIYLEFLGVVEDLPHWLQLAHLVGPLSASGAHIETFQRECFWVQRCTLIMAFQCLKVVIMERCIESGLVGVMSIRDDPLSTGIKKAELIQGFVQALEDIPFVYHQVKGEPSVQRIRIVGTILLEMVQNAEHDIIQPRVASYFRRLLDVLAKLNSKASEELDV